MKFLKGQTEVVERDNIKLGLKVMDTTMQAEITEMSRGEKINDKIKMVGYMLTNCISTVSIDGIEYNPEYLRRSADISDLDTLRIMMKISGMVIDAAYSSVEDVKK